MITFNPFADRIHFLMPAILRILSLVFLIILVTLGIIAYKIYL